MKLIWSDNGKKAIVGLDKIVEFYIREVPINKDKDQGNRYLVYAQTILDIKQYPSDGVFLKEFNSLDEAQIFIREMML